MITRLAGALCAVLLVAGQAVAQPAGTVSTADDRVEVWGGFTIVAPRLSGTLTTSFVPLLQNSVATGAAGQALFLDHAQRGTRRRARQRIAAIGAAVAAGAEHAQNLA